MPEPTKQILFPFKQAKQPCGNCGQRQIRKPQFVKRKPVTNGTSLNKQTSPYKLLLRNSQCPGDAIVMTCAVESLHRTYPNLYQTDRQTTGQDIWLHNPRITKLQAVQCHIIEMHYDAINENGERDISFMGAFCEHLGNAIGRPLVPQVTKPCLYLSQEENQPLDELKGVNYVVGNFGTKEDFTCKYAGRDVWQNVVVSYPDYLFIQIGEDNPYHHHPRINGGNIQDWVGRTQDLRKLFRLVKFATACVGPESMLNHVAASFSVPSVVLAGGRFPPNWITYNSTYYLHSIGLLDCCKEKACGKSRTVALNDGATNDNSLCVLPVVQGEDTIPRCLQLLGSESVIAALRPILRGK